jgi:heme exporter protein D
MIALFSCITGVALACWLIPLWLARARQRSQYLANLERELKAREWRIKQLKCELAQERQGQTMAGLEIALRKRNLYLIPKGRQRE